MLSWRSQFCSQLCFFPHDSNRCAPLKEGYTTFLACVSQGKTPLFHALLPFQASLGISEGASGCVGLGFWLGLNRARRSWHSISPRRTGRAPALLFSSPPPASPSALQELQPNECFGLDFAKTCQHISSLNSTKSCMAEGLGGVVGCRD